MISMLIQTLKKIGKKLLIAIIWLGIWQALSAIVGLSVLLPSPVDTLKELSVLMRLGNFWLSVLLSVTRILTGFISGVIFGVLIGSVSAFSDFLGSFLAPVVSIVKATPVASFIILALVWFKTGNVPSFATALLVFPFIYSNVRTGINETDKKLLEMSDAFGVSEFRKITKIYIPSVKPYFISATTTAMGLAWKAGIAAEVICNPKMSIGSGIYESKIYLETPRMFAWTAVVIILSIILEKTMVYILKRGAEDDKA